MSKRARDIFQAKLLKEMKTAITAGIPLYAGEDESVWRQSENLSCTQFALLGNYIRHFTTFRKTINGTS